MASDLTTAAGNVADDVSSAWDEVETTEASGVAAPPPEPQAPEVDGGRFRGPDGRFAVAPEVPPAGQGQQTAGVTEGPPAASASYMPPNSWSPAAKHAFASLPPQVQEAVALREQQMAEGQQMYQGLRQWVEHAEANGTTLPEVLNDYYNAHQQLATDLYSGIGNLCRYFGQDPYQLAMRAVAEMQGQPYQAPPQDPMIPYLQQLEGRIQDLYGFHERQQSEAINSQLEAFAQNHIYFHDVEPYMAEIINYARANEGVELSLEQAYEHACWLHPQVREIMMQERAAGPSQGQAPSPQPPHKGRSLNPGSPIPGVSSERLTTKKSNTAIQDVAELYDALSGI